MELQPWTVPGNSWGKFEQAQDYIALVCVCLLGPTTYRKFQIRIFTKVECPQLSTCTSHEDYCQTVSMKETIKAGAQSRTVEIIAWQLTEVTSCRGSCMNEVHIYIAEIQLPTWMWSLAHVCVAIPWLIYANATCMVHVPEKYETSSVLLAQTCPTMIKYLPSTFWCLP